MYSKRCSGTDPVEPQRAGGSGHHPQPAQRGLRPFEDMSGWLENEIKSIGYGACPS